MADEHVASKFALAKGERRRRDIQQDLAACADQVFYRIDAVQAAVPEVLVVPGVFADGERARGASQRIRSDWLSAGAKLRISSKTS